MWVAVLGRTRIYRRFYKSQSCMQSLLILNISLHLNAKNKHTIWKNDLILCWQYLVLSSFQIVYLKHSLWLESLEESAGKLLAGCWSWKLSQTIFLLGWGKCQLYGRGTVIKPQSLCIRMTHPRTGFYCLRRKCVMT